ncbi:MAG: DMT family transporter [Gemmatimonas sp.]|uniref:DMT family transporter n=1 Tax=Gemmatimonas sp. TaxID=1962908 RepID=UPI0025BC9D5A|nr:DMT family transporter [Gemmatimonas sp.]MCE2952564.1 DMT family transporter [Gemmatimonas sp.]
MSASPAARRAIWRGTLAVVFSACCFGSISPLTVVATERGMALESIQSWRYFASAALVVAYGWWRPPAPAAGLSPWYHPRTLLMAGGGQAIVATLALAALRWLPAATASFLFYTYPAWVTVITAVRGLEPLDGSRLLALALALGGIVAMVGAPSAASLSPVGLAVILSGALVYALYIPVLSGLQRGRDGLDVARAICVGGTLCFATWSMLSGTLFAIPDAVALGASVLQGVLASGAFVGFLAGLRILGNVRTAITSTVEPFWTTLLGVVLLAQPVGTGTLVGGAAIMAAVLLLQRPVASAPTRSS